MRQTYARHVLVLAALAAISADPGTAVAARAQSLDREVEATLRSLYEKTPEARELAPSARGILVFPDIFRENYYYTFGVQSGNGALLVGARSSATTPPARSPTDRRPAPCRLRPSSF
jgi:lipid-binding SYLF domain-containing protein